MEVNLITECVKRLPPSPPLTFSEINNAESSLKFYHKVLEMARVKKKCAGCNRPFQENEMDPLQAYVSSPVAGSELTADQHSYPACLQL
jgi:hypothetical protein